MLGGIEGGGARICYIFFGEFGVEEALKVSFWWENLWVFLVFLLQRLWRLTQVGLSGLNRWGVT